MAKKEVPAPVSVAISVSDPRAVSTVLTAALEPQLEDSVQLALRGSPQDVISVLTGLRDPSAVSALLSIRKS